MFWTRKKDFAQSHSCSSKSHKEEREYLKCHVFKHIFWYKVNTYYYTVIKKANVVAMMAATVKKIGGGDSTNNDATVKIAVAVVVVVVASVVVVSVVVAPTTIICSHISSDLSSTDLQNLQSFQKVPFMNNKIHINVYTCERILRRLLSCEARERTSEPRMSDLCFFCSFLEKWVRSHTERQTNRPTFLSVNGKFEAICFQQQIMSPWRLMTLFKHFHYLCVHSRSTHSQHIHTH